MDTSCCSTIACLAELLQGERCISVIVDVNSSKIFITWLILLAWRIDLWSSPVQSSLGFRNPLVGQGKVHGLHFATSGRDAFEGGRQISSLCQHLESVDEGPLGITDCQRLSSPLCGPTCTGKEAKSSLLSIRATSSNTGGSHFPVRERGSDSSRQSRSPERILLGSLPGPQKEWANEASDQSQSSQSVGRDPRLVSKGRPQGCQPHSTSASRPSM